MKKYKFTNTIYRTNEDGLIEFVKNKNVIVYKCLICNAFTKEWDETFDDVKKAEVKAEVDKHHNDHIIPDE